MNKVSPEMLNCLHMPENLAGNCTDMSVLDRQRTRLKWQQQQQHSQQSQENYFNETQFDVFTAQTAQIQQFQALLNNDFVLRELANRSMKADPGMENVWADLSKYPVPRTGFNSPEMDFPLSRTSSCSPAVAVENGSESVLTEKMASVVGRESFKKRKADKSQNPKVVVAEIKRDKRIKDDAEEVESKITEENTNNNNNNREVSADTSKENSKVTEVQKLDYIHVRARRGQATDSHSLAERVRREKISERMKYLQDLVPGCNKITGKAGMLDEIINYVQSLQRQVEFLSMKLATVNPRLDFNIDNLFVKEMFPTMGMSEMANPAAYLQFNPEPETFVDSSCFTQAQASSNWESGLQSLYNVDFHQPFTGRELGS